MVMTKKQIKEYKDEWYAKNREERKDNCKEYYKKNKDKIKEDNKQWRKENPEKNKYLHSKNQKDYEKKYPEKIKAHKLAIYRIKIPEGCLCEICKEEKAKHRHHPDYSKPLDVVLVCIKCHNKLHNEGEI